MSGPVESPRPQRTGPDGKVLVNVARKRGEGRVLIVDADIVAYQAADLALREEQINEVEWRWTMHMPSAQEDAAMKIEQWEVELGADRSVLCFGSASNWRKFVLPSYKANRSTRKPLGYLALVEWMRSEWEHLVGPFLEADDLVGLCMTGAFPEIVRENEPVIVSEDKDLRGIPGLLYNPRRPEDWPTRTSEAEADRWHLIQWLTGDATDNYKGCPGFGPVSAEKLVDEHLPDLGAACDAIFLAYEAKGISREDALAQARVSRILRNGEFDPSTGETFLWEPPRAKRGRKKRRN